MANLLPSDRSLRLLYTLMYTTCGTQEKREVRQMPIFDVQVTVNTTSKRAQTVYVNNRQPPRRRSHPNPRQPPQAPCSLGHTIEAILVLTVAIPIYPHRLMLSR